MKIVKLYLIVIAFFTITGCNEDNNDLLSGGSKDLVNVDNTYERQIMNLINDFRESQGKSRLKASSFIKKCTDAHNKYMINRGTISHDKYNSRIKPIQKKFNSYYVTENVAYNHSTDPNKVVNQWINSSGHRENMLGKRGKKYSHLYVSATKDSKGRWYYTAIFV